MPNVASQQEITRHGTEAITDFYNLIAIDRLNLPGLTAFVTKCDSASLNVVIDTRDKTNKLTHAVVNEISNFFTSHNVPWNWFITEESKSHDLIQHGFALSYQMPAMYLDLDTIQLKTTNDFEIKEMNDELYEWIKPIEEGFPSPDNNETFRALNARLLQQGEKKLRHFSAYRENEAIASGTLFLSNHSVMIHNLATKIMFRKQGFASALTLHLMTEAKKSGYRHCFLDASLKGINLYEQLGFKKYGITSVYQL